MAWKSVISYTNISECLRVQNKLTNVAVSVVMVMMMSQILKFVDSNRTQSKYLENQTIFPSIENIF